MESELDWHSARALLEWQVELGVDEAIGDAPVDRFAEAEAARAAQQAVAEAPAQGAKGRPAPPVIEKVDPVAEARKAAQAAPDLTALAEAMAAFEHCDLKRGARNLVFADGNPEARVMIVGEAPGRDEDLQGKPFVGRAGRLLDRMFEAIGMGRDAEGDKAVYITNVLPWRPPRNRDPKPDEIGMLTPFLMRHIQLADPDLLIIMGNISCEALLGKRGITRLRGQWTEAAERPALPMFHPAYLLRQPHLKRAAWADLLEVQAKLRSLAR